MPEIEIRPAIASDISALASLDHSYISEYVWQLELNIPASHENIHAHFRRVRLPRPVRVEYPRPPGNLVHDWTQRSGILVALFQGEPIGYIALTLRPAQTTTWVNDLAIAPRLRRQGVGSALVLAAIEWAAQMDTQNLIMEMQPKNYPAIQMARKLGFDFCGYNDRYYARHEIGVFFAKAVH